MPDDPRAEQARAYHREAASLGDQARLYRASRDELIRGMYADKPAGWSYGKLAEAVGCSKELIAQILHPR